MGLLDSLLNQTYGNNGGGLLGYLQSPLYQSPLSSKSETDDFVKALRNDPYGGSMLAPPQASPFDQPGIVYRGAPPAQPGPFQTGMAPIAGFPSAAPSAPPPMPQTPQMAPAAPQQAGPISIGNYQMPRIGAASAYEPQQSDIPPNARPTQGQMQQPMEAPQQLPPALGGQPGGFLGQPGGFLGQLSEGLRSIGNGGSLLGALTGNRNDPQSIAQQNLSSQFQALRQTLQQSGMSPQEAGSKAMLAIMNPEAGKTILNEALTSKEEFKTVKDALGAEHGYWINNRDQTMRPADGATGGALGQGPSLLAPGVKDYNPNLTGGEYLNQFGPEVKAAVNAYINGDVMPSGNPRTQAIATKAKEIAIKYGADMGIPVSDSLYAEKKKYRTELGTNSPNSAGGQAKAFNQGIDHLSHLATTLENLDNSNGLGIPAVASTVNAIRQGVSTKQSAISDEAKSLGQTVAGEVGKLFSGSAGGGVHERELTRERFDTAKSKPQLAAALRATIETMQGGLHALEQRRDSVMGPNNGIELIDQTTRQKVQQIQGVIDRLEGKATAQIPGLPSGWSVQVR